MGEKGRNLAGNDHMNRFRRLWGLRPWKRHSTILMVAGILYGFIGFQYITAQPSRIREASLIVVLQIAPLEFWGCVFLAAGILTSVSSRWPPFAEKWGYMVLTGLSGAWGAAYLTGVSFYKAPASAISQIILWGLLAFIWWAISGLLNPDSTGVIHNGSD